MNRTTELVKILVQIFVGMSVILTPIAAWITHVIHTIQSEEWIFLLIGSFIAPIGVIHGIGLWFGIF